MAIVGPSGCGKSTLLHVCGAMERPSAGRITLDGQRLDTLSDDGLTRVRRERLGFVFQFFNLLPTLTLLENVALPLLLAGAPESRALAAPGSGPPTLGLAHRLDHRPAQLSGGEMQRAAIARAVVHDPALVLADEPTGNLDSANGAHMLEFAGAPQPRARPDAAAGDACRGGRRRGRPRRPHARWPRRSHRRRGVTPDGTGACRSLGWFILRRLRSERVRTALTVAGIALGVAVVLAIRLANAQRARRVFRGARCRGRPDLARSDRHRPRRRRARLAALGWLRKWGDVSPVVEGDAVAMLVAEPHRSRAGARRRCPSRPAVPRVPAADVGAGERAADSPGVSRPAPRPVVGRHHRGVCAPARPRRRASGRRRSGGRSTLRLAMGDQVRAFRDPRAAAQRRPGPGARRQLRPDGHRRRAAGRSIGSAASTGSTCGSPTRRASTRRSAPSARGCRRAWTCSARRGAASRWSRCSRRFSSTSRRCPTSRCWSGLFLVYNTVATSVIARRDEIGMLRALGDVRDDSARACSSARPRRWRRWAAWSGSRSAGRWRAAAVALYLLDGDDALCRACRWRAGADLRRRRAGDWRRRCRWRCSRPPRRRSKRRASARCARFAAASTTLAVAPVRGAGLLGGAACLLASAACSQAGPVGGLPIFGFAAAVLIVFGLAALVPPVLAGLARATRGAMLRVARRRRPAGARQPRRRDPPARASRWRRSR